MAKIYTKEEIIGNGFEVKDIVKCAVVQTKQGIELFDVTTLVGDIAYVKVEGFDDERVKEFTVYNTKGGIPTKMEESIDKFKFMEMTANGNFHNANNELVTNYSMVVDGEALYYSESKGGN